MPKKLGAVITPFPCDLQATPREVRKNPPHKSNQARMQPPAPRASNGDSYYGYEYIARLCARFMEDIFESSELMTSSSRGNLKDVELPYFIAKAIHRAEKVHPRTDIRPRTPFAALLIIKRLKRINNQFLAKRDVGADELFLTAFMMAYKVINEPPYKLTTNDWVTIGQDSCSGAELESYEKRLQRHLGGDVYIDITQLERFEQDMMSQYGSERRAKSRNPMERSSLKSASESNLVGLGFGLDVLEKQPGTSKQSMKKPVTERPHPSPKKKVLQLHVAPPALPIRSSRTKVNDYATGEVYYTGSLTLN